MMLRTDRARALREAVHLACREAVLAKPDQELFAQAQALLLPQVEQESAHLMQQPGMTAPLPQSQTLSQPPQVDPLPRHPVHGPGQDELTVAVSIFLSEEDGHDRIEEAVEGLLTEQGFEVVWRSTVEAGR